jgi:hypothetical protein
MTVLGKILTFFIFCFSLVFLGFAFTINQLNKEPASGKSWYQAHLDAVKERKALEADLKARNDEIAELRGKIAAQNSVLASTIQQADAKVTQANDARRLEKSRADQMETAFRDSQVAAATTMEELKRRREENGELVQTLKTREAEIADLRSQVTAANNLRTKAEVASASYASRLQKMEKDYADLARAYEDIVAKKAEKSVETGIKTPPPEDVQGEVEEVGVDGLISISIGSDAGLLRGHVLNVFRLTPKPSYLGEIRIIDVTPHKAVGKLLNPEYRKIIKKGDLVANRIVGAGVK